LEAQIQGIEKAPHKIFLRKINTQGQSSNWVSKLDKSAENRNLTILQPLQQNEVDDAFL